MNTSVLSDIIARYDTPTYVFDTTDFQARIRETAAIFGERIDVCYSMKANPFLVDAACETSAKLEVCSPGELDICIARKVEPARIIYSGVCKGTEDIRRALRYGVGVITAESPVQFSYINEVAQALYHESALSYPRVPVLLRLNAKSQFGMAQRDLEDIVAAREQYPLIDFVGIHYFVGTQRKKLTHQIKELQMLERLIDDLDTRLGWKAQMLEYGPGLAFEYFTDAHTPASVRDANMRAQKSFESAHELAPYLQKLSENVHVCVEMGRFFASSCGAFLTRIVDLKQGYDEDTHYAFIDGGINHVSYLGQMMGLKCPLIAHIPYENSASISVSAHVSSQKTWCICGSLCTTSDVLVREFAAPLAIGDTLAFLNIGAYSVTESMYLFLSRTMPCVVLYDSSTNETRLVRKPFETSTLNSLQS